MNYKVKRPFGDRVLVKRDTWREQHQVPGSDIVLTLPDTAKDKANTGVIVARGPEVSGMIEVGMHVLFGRYSGTEIDDLVLLREAELHALLE